MYELMDLLFERNACDDQLILNFKATVDHKNIL